jgi:hypothetical protein
VQESQQCRRSFSIFDFRLRKALLRAQPGTPFESGGVAIPFVLPFQFEIEFRAVRSLWGRGGNVVLQFPCLLLTSVFGCAVAATPVASTM